MLNLVNLKAMSEMTGINQTRLYNLARKNSRYVMTHNEKVLIYDFLALLVEELEVIDNGR